MALYTRYVLVVDEATGSDTQGSGSSATVKDSDSISGTTLVITNAGGGSTVTKADLSAFAGPPIAGVDTMMFTDTVGGLMLGHIVTMSGDNKTATLVETPATGTSIGNPWGVGGYFDTIARAALLVTPTNTNAGADDHCYVKAGTYTGTVKVTFSKAGAKSRPLVFEGFTTSPGDGGRTTYDITATATIAFEPNANDQVYRNFKLTNSGAVASWSALFRAGGRCFVSNCWGTSPSGNATRGLRAAEHAFMCRAGSIGSGIEHGDINHVLFSIAHDLNTTGGAQEHGYTGAGAGATVFCTAYSAATHGMNVLNDANSALCWTVLGSIFSNCTTTGVRRTGITTDANPWHLEAYNDFFGNGTDRTNAEDTTSYDTVPTDLTIDPQFVDAANQNFAIGANLKAKAAQVFQVGGTSFLDMGAVQRVEPVGGVTARTSFIPGAAV